LPDLYEQRRISGRLEQADRLVRTRRYALELTDSFLPAAFLELFGDPAENPRAFDRVHVEDLFADSRDGAKCGPFGSALKKHEYVAAGVPVWTMNNVGANEFLEDGCLYITPQKFEELAAYDAQNGDILISRAGTVGRMAIVRTTHPRSVIHTNIIRLSLNHAKILPIYFVALMTWFAPRVARLKRGQEDAYTFMSTGSLGELRIPLPPFPLQQKFAALVERVECLRAIQREALRQAEHLFGSLLHRAFSGDP
jgi:type I restriction enzyme S subunit